MAEIKKFIPLLLRHEGGYTNNPNDKGNYNSKGELVGTKYGISAKVYEEYFDKIPTELDMRTITPDQFETVARNYWDAWSADLIDSQAVANFLVDWYYNSGAWGIKLPQRFLHLKEDGIVGPKTIAAVNSSDPYLLFIGLKQERKEFIENIVKHNPPQAVFLNGWLNRIASFNYAG